MGLHRKTAGILALMMGVTSVPVVPWNVESKAVYASIASESNGKESVRRGSSSNAATMSNAVTFITGYTKEIPPWYELLPEEGDCYSFYGRDGERQYRRYGGFTDEEQWGWYPCSIEGVVQSDAKPISIEEEFLQLAPYVYQDESVSEDAWSVLEDFLGETDWEIEKKEGYGRNYDGSFYDIWKVTLKDKTNYYFYYGHPANTLEEMLKVNRWYVCDEQGNVLSFLLSNLLANSLLTARAMEIQNLEERVSREGDTIHIYLRGRASAQRPHLDGVVLFNDASWSCSANNSNPTHFSTGHSYQRKSGSNYYTVNVDFGYLMQLGEFCSNGTGVNGKTYTEENPVANIWDGTYKDGEPDFSSSSSMVWAESVTWTGNYDYVYDEADQGTNIFELEIAIKNPIPQFSGLAMQLWNGDRTDSESSFGYESIGNYRITENIASISSQAHVHTGNLVKTEPSCTSAGAITGTCDLCKKAVNETILALGHQTGKPVSEGGYTIVRCERCKQELSRQANSYQLTFHPNGGTSDTTQKSVTYQEAYGTLPVPKREFYRFDGWYTAETGGTLVTSSSKYTTVGNQTVYAHWTRIEADFEFNANGGTGGGTVSALYGKPFGELPNASREGYEFLGWFTAKEGGTQITASSIAPEKTAQYYAHWKICSYTAQFHGNGGEDGSSITKNYQEALGTLPDSKRVGYSLLGWFTQREGGTKATSQTKMPVGGAEYFAQWKPITYKVHYTGNYASEGNMEDSVFTYDQKGNLVKNQYKKTGYLFQGWKDNQGNLYSDGAEIHNLTAVQGEIINLKAQWLPISYQFVFYPGSGIGEPMGTQDYVYGESQRLMENTYTKKGYRFSKWTTNEDGTGDSFIDKKAVENYSNQDGTVISLYAQWIPNTYKILFDSNGGSCKIQQKEVVFDAQIGELPIPEKLNSKFVGWYQQGTESLVTANTIFTSDANMTLYAVYELNYKEQDDQVNIRPGQDGEFGTEDDEYYFNGEDGTAGTEDDKKIDAGNDGVYGTADDFYLRDDNEDKIYAGQDGQFGTADDYRDLKNNTNQRPGEDLKWDTEDDTLWWNGEDKKPCTKDDWQIEKGQDEVYGTEDDYVDLKDGSNHRAGEDGLWGTEDDILFWNGMDQKPGTEDDKMIYPGKDMIYGTRDDFYKDDATNECIYRGEETQFGKPNNFADHKDGTNTRVGENGIYDKGTKDDIKYLNGKNGIPGDADDVRIEKGEDGEYGTKDDYVDNGDGSNTRPGEDGIWGTEDDETFTNGEDKIPGNEDDKPVDSDDSDGDSSGDGTGGDDSDGDSSGDGTGGDDSDGDSSGDGTGGDDSDGDSSGDGTGGDDSDGDSSGDGTGGDDSDGDSSGDGTGGDDSDGDSSGGNSSGGNSSGGSSSGTSSKSKSSSTQYRTAQGRWIKDEKGWWYQFSDGSYPKNSWQYLRYENRDEWYHFDENGYMQTGWFRDVDERWYHLHTKSDGTLGHMETGWFQDIDGLWYYLNPVSDGHKGAMTVGWRQIQDRWYYFNPISNGTRGAMYAGTVTPDGYLVNEKGEWTGKRADYGKNILSSAWRAI